MKNYILFLIVSASAFSFSCMAQGNEYTQVSPKIDNAQFINSVASNNDLAVVSYHVEERINMNFGGTITTYDVPSLNLINTNNLGPNNTRTVTPRYAKAKVPVETMATNMQPIVNNDMAVLTAEPMKAEPAAVVAVEDVKVDEVVEEETAVETDINKDYITVNIVDMGERVLESGGEKTVEMLKLVANARFFEGNLTKAAKWYTDLFKATTDLEPVYYFRYGQSLKAVGQNSKASNMLEIYENKKAGK